MPSRPHVAPLPSRTNRSRTSRRWWAALAAASLAVTGLSAAIGAPEAEALSGADAGVAVVAAPGGNGYAVVSASGGQYNYGASQFTGSLAGTPLNAPIVGAAAVPGTDSKWFIASDGGVFTEGPAAGFYGSMGGQPLNRPISAIVPSATGKGYLLVAQDGGTFTFGDFPYLGSLAGSPLNAPIVAAARTPDNRGLWLVGSDGGVFTFGTASFYGSMGGKALNAPISSILASPTGAGYLLVGRDGGTFAFGDYPFPGSLVGLHLNQPVVGAAAYNGKTGVWLLGADGGVFTLTAPFYGSAAGESNAPPPTVGQTVSGPSGGRVTVPCPGGGSIIVAAQLGNQLKRLLADAKTAGYTACGSGPRAGYRSPQDQINLRIQNCGSTLYAIYDEPSSSCSPATAKPGSSMHERGLAVDFQTSTNGYTWLKNNSRNYGLTLLVGGSERWHFSTNGR